MFDILMGKLNSMSHAKVNGESFHTGLTITDRNVFVDAIRGMWYLDLLTDNEYFSLKHTAQNEYEYFFR